MSLWEVPRLTIDHEEHTTPSRHTASPNRPAKHRAIANLSHWIPRGMYIYFLFLYILVSKLNKIPCKKHFEVSQPCRIGVTLEIYHVESFLKNHPPSF